MKVTHIKLNLEFSVEEVQLLKEVLESSYKQANDQEDEYYKYSEVESLILDVNQALS